MRSNIVRSTPEFNVYHGVGGPLKVEDVDIPCLEPLGALMAQGFAELGYYFNADCNGKYQLGFCQQTLTEENGRRCSTAKAFLTPVQDRNNLKVSKYSLVSKILIDNNKVAYGVEFIDRHGKALRVLARKEVIVSAGAINTPQLLMLSGIGPQNHLKEFGIPVVADLPVGKNLQDHPIINGLIISLDYSVPKNDEVKDMFNFLLKHNSSLSNTGISTFNVFIDTTNSGVDHPDVQVFYRPTSYSSNFKLEIAQQYNVLTSRSFTIQPAPALLRPKSRGVIRLQSKDPRQYPKIISGYFSHPEDVEVLSRAMKLIRNFAETPPLRAAGAKLHEIKIESCSKFPYNSMQYFECFLRHMASTVYHPSGTCRMGPAGHPEAVVDPQLRVHGVDRLRVIDASIMPRVTTGNTNAPTIMIAEKGSDMVKHRWLSTPYDIAGSFTGTPSQQWFNYGAAEG